jgi:hypothetical protein
MMKKPVLQGSMEIQDQKSTFFPAANYGNHWVTGNFCSVLRVMTKDQDTGYDNIAGIS